MKKNHVKQKGISLQAEMTRYQHDELKGKKIHIVKLSYQSKDKEIIQKAYRHLKKSTKSQESEQHGY